ncbi:MAG: HD-GYP domain-containing protein [Oscillospiraceae bacterium]|nr:HD-GYP domain-containing protein [Oscillospiraceae bacterium]
MPAPSKGFVRIDSTIFFEGMFVSTDLYCRFRSNYVLVIKSTLLTKKVLEKIKQLEATYGDLYVMDEFYDRLIGQSEQYNAILKKLEFDTNYRSIKEKTTNLLGDISKSGSVNREATNILSKVITEKLFTIDTAVIIQVLNSVRSTDEYLFTHCSNVSILNGLIGKWLGLDQNEINTLVAAGLMHDIGKLKIPAEILNKPARLTKSEFEIIKTHPVHSFNMLVQSGEVNREILSAARNHHEKTNGSGYPDGLKGVEISRSARITAISDIYDAMISRRSYKEARSPFEILEQFSKGSFTNLDLDIVAAFLENMPNELLGKSVLLSNGMVGKVEFIDPSNFCYPIVTVGNDVITTNGRLKCVCMCADQ